MVVTTGDTRPPELVEIGFFENSNTDETRTSKALWEIILKIVGGDDRSILGVRDAYRFIQPVGRNWGLSNEGRMSNGHYDHQRHLLRTEKRASGKIGT